MTCSHGKDDCEHYSVKGKDVGWMVRDAYYSKRKKSKHLMRKFNAWGINADIFEKIHKQGCKSIRVLDEEEGIVYSSAIEDYKAHGIFADFDGLQMFLPLDYWKKEKKV
jgi:hypothetical protein